MARISTLQEYKNSLSFSELCNYFLELTYSELKKIKGEKKFIIGYHIRHFLDSDAPTYLAKPYDESQQKFVTKTILENKEKGKHTFNHIIDNLYYNKSINTDTLINLQINFNDEIEIIDILNDDFNSINACATIKKSDFKNEFEVAPNILPLIKRLGLDLNLENIKSIYNALEQLKTYSEFGDKIQCLILRPKNQFGFVVGVSIISDELIDMSSIHNYIISDFKFLNAKNKPKNEHKSINNISNDLILTKINDIKPLSFYSNHNLIPNSFYEDIIGIKDNLNEYFTKKEALESFEKTTQSFISLISDFCDEKIEGNPLTFGFVLGNPGLLNFLKNTNIFPSILSGNQEFSNIDSIKSNIHLFSNHEISSIVIPYLDDFKIDSENRALPSFVLPMQSFEEDIFNWDEGTLIPSTYRPYAFLSYRFPWLLSAVIGPHSQIRLFKDGRIVAFKDGKGWKSASFNEEDKIKIQKSAFNNDFKFQELVDFARLFSPIYNPNSHGGFITYVDSSDDAFNDEVRNEYEKCFEPLVDKIPCEHNGKKWLKSENLFRSKKYGISFELDTSVCSKMLQTCVLDGAISLEGKDYEVKSFGNRLNFKITSSMLHKFNNIREDIDIPVSGTKRKTAMEFVRWCSSKGLKKYFAIAISSDGPLRIFLDTKTDNGKLKLEDIQIFKLFR